MSSFGAFSVITDENDKILLVKRRDVPLWDLPGGRVEVGETAEQAAIREVYEETGFTVTLIGTAGDYYNPERDDIQYIFRAEIVAGKAISSGPETAAIRFFSKNHLPFLTIPNRKMQIKNALTELSKTISQEIHDPFFVKYFKK
ncbi:NUDIX hydrolase [Lactococcus nasutitermitis]|uniref:NUDIX hydrolase n=1 Tax=Lactococcus nasutitermitis TaxID=1652957 RepID=A0ABV9J9T5_9LACT|nr:NUDIX hydrolase [Lactococcus nasutitermitis]